MIDRYISECIDRSDLRRVRLVEDAHFKKMISGDGSAADYIFYLTNRASGRWADKRALISNTNINSNKVTVSPFKDFKEDELDAIVNGITNRIKPEG